MSFLAMNTFKSYSDPYLTSSSFEYSIFLKKLINFVKKFTWMMSWTAVSYYYISSVN